MLFGLSMTGCIQTMVIKTSSYSGAGTEYYTSYDKLSPNVTTLEPGKKDPKVDKDEKALETGEFKKIVVNDYANYHVNYRNHAELLKKLRQQAGEDVYGKYNSYSSSIQWYYDIHDENGKLKNDYEKFAVVKGNNDKYLFNMSESSIYQPIYTTYKDIKFIDPRFNLISLYNLIDPKDVSKGYELKVANLEKTYTEYETTKNKLKATLFSIATPDQIKLKNKLNGRDISNIDLSKQLYARDVLEFLYNKTFVEQVNGKDNYFVRRFKDTAENGGFSSSDYNDIFKKIVVDKSLTKLNQKQFDLLLEYSSILAEYFKNTGFTNKYDDTQFEERKLHTPKDNKTSEKIIKENAFLIPDTKLVYSHSEPFKPFVTWGDSWRHWGPFFGLFVYPISWLTGSIREKMPSLSGWSTIFVIIIAVIITRLFSLAITWKSQVNQSKQEDIKAKKAKIDAKYADFKGNKQMKMRHQQEIAALYKKNNINPLDAFLNVIISFPIFISMWRVIQSIPEMKSTVWLGMSFAATSWKRLFAGEWVYLGILVVALVVQFFSQFLPKLLTRKKFKERTTIEEEKALKKSNKTQNIVMIVFLFITLMFSCGVQVYWIFSGLWNIIQTVAIHYFKKSAYYRRKYINAVT
ncbi:membrane protein insertase YidC [Mycoplasmopsis caviae]|uniref:membrane protein insertase YidC n=1 Tax=Mycoplasmopsis caviae TaxID=55603 RepID=UPI001F1C8FD1|nr:membrane protein insertase YidC [Mycoplasmopsis caviae]